MLAFFFLSFVSLCHGFLVNSTIDDSFPDQLTGEIVQYSPAEAWNNGRNCDRCSARPSQSLLHRETWHDGTFNRNNGSNAFPNQPLFASVRFKGEAVYVYCVIPRTADFPAGHSDMTFFIDNQRVGVFVRNPPGTPGFDYDVLVYQNTSIPPGPHELIIQNGNRNGPKSILMLDRIVYSYDNGEPEKRQTALETSTIVGIVLGALAAICLIVVGVYWYFACRRRKTAQPAQPLKLELETGGSGMGVHSLNLPAASQSAPYSYQRDYAHSSNSYHPSGYSFNNLTPEPHHPRPDPYSTPSDRPPAYLSKY
ncbi:hypothetical protein FA15DRAFT_662752 [Coprinopsis marcescibilis]|uniref:Uncharacterized protein n=1 Tax=Coprinopsis marcescibilis TaxID=230819 RepID=A0A5C3LD80_COPMA|nr:hypothetical protein FA15DRAFT_662752 [Coprinopsis marcescibilis]